MSSNLENVQILKCLDIKNIQSLEFYFFSETVSDAVENKT
jgi:hypothetical protein